MKRELSNSYIYTLRLNFHPFGPKCVNLISWKSANSVDGISTITIAYLWCLPFQANSGLPGAFSFHFLQICLKLKVTCGSLEHYLNVAYLCSFGKCLDIFLPLACWGIRHCIAWKTGALRLCARGICKYPLLLLFLLYSGEQTRTFRVFQKLNTVECCPHFWHLWHSLLLLKLCHGLNFPTSLQPITWSPVSGWPENVPIMIWTIALPMIDLMIDTSVPHDWRITNVRFNVGIEEQFSGVNVYDVP